MYLNAQSIINKMCEFTEILNYRKPDICGITEFGAGDNVCDAEISIPGYTLYRQNHKSGSGGPGKGVAIYVKNTLYHSNCKEMGSTAEDFEAAVWIRVKLSAEMNLIVGNCYRSPNANEEENGKLLKSLQKVNKLKDSHLIVMGDFNLPKIDWMSGLVNDTHLSYSTQFIETTESMGWIQKVNDITRFRGTDIPSLLDLVFSKDEDLVDKLETHAPIGKSDHAVLTWQMPVNRFLYKNTNRKIFKFGKANWKEIQRELTAVNWSFIEDEPVNISYPLIINIIQRLKRKYVPTSTYRDSPNAPWTKKAHVKRARKAKWAAFKRWQRTRDPTDHDCYVRERNKAKSLLRNEKVKHEKQLIEDVKNPKRLQAYCRSKTKIKKGIGNVMKKDGDETSSERETAEAFNEFLQSVFTGGSLQEGTLRENPINKQIDPFTDFGFTPEDVLNVLKALKTAKASGPDEVDSAFLKNCAEELKTPLYTLFRKSLDTSIIPNEWKQADISPIHKKGPNNDVNNYRPVNLTSQVSKAFESILSEKLMNHLYSHSLISEEQHGFVKGRNCQTNILSCMEDWTRALDENDSVDIIYFDYEKAFDKVSHPLLLEKLKWYGIEGRVFEWIKSFLTERVQRVKIGNVKSTWKAVLSSVVQGSVLGVNLFVIYINDLPATCLPCLSCPSSGYGGDTNMAKIKLLADDTKAYQRIHNGREAEDAAALQGTIDQIYKWAETWEMKIHPNKTKVLHVGPKNPRHIYKINGTVIDSCEVQKDIGFMVPENLSTSNHVQSARTKALMEIGIMRRTFAYLDKRSFTILYNQKIRTHLEWGSVAYPPQTKAESSLLERAQNKATNMVNEFRGLNSDERREDLGLFSLTYRRLQRRYDRGLQTPQRSDKDGL